MGSYNASEILRSSHAIPIVVIPGILAFNLFRGDLRDDAVNRNALVLSAKTPELFDSLSPAMHPDRDDSRNAKIRGDDPTTGARES